MNDYRRTYYIDDNDVPAVNDVVRDYDGEDHWNIADQLVSDKWFNNLKERKQILLIGL